MPRLAFAAVLALTACHGGGVTSDEEAEGAYIGLDTAIVRGMNLGMDGYNAASSANIPDQTAPGDVSGTMTVSGQVDQGSSDNKGMRLSVALVDYADGVALDSDTTLDVTYATDAAAQPALDLSLRNIPDGTFSGTFVGAIGMTGDLEGDVTLDVAMDGAIETDPDDAAKLRRVEGTTHITGTATSDYGTYDIDVTR